jgi:hypothetical protein
MQSGRFEAFRTKAEAKMLSHARRALHSAAKTIRQDAIPDCIDPLANRLSFSRFVIANLVAIDVTGVLALAAISGEAPRLGALRDVFAPIDARLFAGP